MNQAQSRRLRMRCLLLLAPLLVASTPSSLSVPRAQMLPSGPTRLVFLTLPEEIAKDQCVPITVEAQDSNGVPSSPGSPVPLVLTSSLLGGAFFASNTCQSAISSVVLPGSAERVQVWFKATALGLVTLTASDGLLGMADALSVPISIVLNPTSRLVFSRVPSSATVGQPIEVTLEARDLLGFVATGYSGTIEFRSTDPNAVLPQRYTFNPSTDRGRKTFRVTFLSGGTRELVAQDVARSNLSASANIPVQVADAVRLVIQSFPADTFPGRPVSFSVLALDANGNPGRLAGDLVFESDDSTAQLPPSGPLQPSYTVTFNQTGSRSLTVRAPTANATLEASVGIVINQPAASSVEMRPSLTRLETCQQTRITLTADATLEPTRISLCRPGDRAAAPVASSGFDFVELTNQCATGTFRGTAEVAWESKRGEDVPLTLYGAETDGPVTIFWVAEPHLELTSFLFFDTSEDIPKLPVSTGERTLQLALSDTCRQPLVPPPGMEVTFSASPQLSISSSYNPDTPGQWIVTARLPECPANPSQPLLIQPRVNGSAIRLPDGEEVARFVQPRCATAVELSINSPKDGEAVEPGGEVELEVELDNKGQQAIVNGVLRVSVAGLSVIEAHLDGDPLTAQSGGFVIPELLPGDSVKVKVKTQVTTNLQQEVKVEVWYADSDGAELTSPRTVPLTLNGLGVNVGCGCHAASLPGQLFPWLALLLAASRPWDRSRRLRQSERIDR
jgi:hypothetical protein